MAKKKARVIAFYLPQFHPIPENDKWWGKGFTEWTNVAKAKPLFKGHYQPKIPADLGFYDLRMPEIREAQAEMARDAGIEGFCYWHYWFGNGKRLLERPFNEVLESGKPDFPFCLGWANHSWSNKTWDNKGESTTTAILQKQLYPGEKDNIEHFHSLLPAFKDKRYITVDNCPLFYILKPDDIPNVVDFVKLWNSLAIKNGLKGIHFVANVSTASLKNFNRAEYSNPGIIYNKYLNFGFNAISPDAKTRAFIAASGGIYKNITQILFSRLFRKKYSNKLKQKYINKFLYTKEDKREEVYPVILPNWDRSPRSKNSTILIDSTPDVFEKNINQAIKLIDNKSEEHKIIFLKSWNEWAEGNYMEPDLKYGKGYIKALKQSLDDFTNLNK